MSLRPPPRAPRRTPWRRAARAGLLLDDHHTRAASRERLGSGDAADPGADDDHIGCLPFAHSLYGITKYADQEHRSDPARGLVQGGLPVRDERPGELAERAGP